MTDDVTIPYRLDCSMTESKVEYMYFSFVGFKLMIGSITVFDFCELIPLLTSFMKPFQLGSFSIENDGFGGGGGGSDVSN